uniref:PDZ domain containing 3 n=1 Tax=Amazona collaria TaxID=241587 RepID=A0A8B9J1L9_9PSIT
MSLSPSPQSSHLSEALAVGEPRFYLLSKDSTETFGFYLNEELGCQGHVIRQVELGGLAQRRGLQDGDRLLQVNGHFVDHMDHHRVVQKIKASGNQVLLAVLDGDSYEAAKALGRDLSQMLPADIRPRLCHITRDKSGFGFSVSGVKGTFQLSVQQDGPAERAGVPPGSWLLELNGASVSNYSHAQLTKKLKQSGSKVTLLVASSAVEEFYRLRGLRATAALADTSWLPFKVRELHMVKGPAGYGFLLKEDDCSSGATGQFMWDVDAGLPADQAGMKEGDRLLAVNGESIEGLDHQQTVLRIRARDDRVTLLVIDPAGDAFYHSVGFGEHWGGARLDDRVDALPQGLRSEVLSRGPVLLIILLSCPACPNISLAPMTLAGAERPLQPAHWVRVKCGVVDGCAAHNVPTVSPQSPSQEERRRLQAPHPAHRWLPPGSPESAVLLSMAIAHRPALSPCLQWGLQHHPSRNSSPLTEDGSKLLLTGSL